MPCCCAVGCRNRAEEGFKMFRFPADSNRKRLWLANLRRDSWMPTAHSRMCEVHFDPTQFESNRMDGRKLLKPFAVPKNFPSRVVKSSRKLPARRETAAVGGERAMCIIISQAHFTNDQYELNRADGLRKLNPNAIPTIFSHRPMKVGRKPPAERSSIDGITINKRRKQHSNTSHEEFPTPMRGFPDEDMPGCAAVGCSNRTENGYSLKSFPRDPQRRALWTAMVNRENWTPTNSSYICEKHFDDNQWEVMRVDGKKKLKVNAIPTIFELSPKKKPALRKKQRKKFNGLDILSEAIDRDSEVDRLMCLVCCCPLVCGNEISANTTTATTGVTMKQRLIQITDSDSHELWKKKRMELLCHRCVQLVNYVDKMESELALLKSALSGCVMIQGSNQNRNQLNEELVSHLLVLDEFHHNLSDSSSVDMWKDPLDKEFDPLETTERTQESDEISPGLETLDVNVVSEDDGKPRESEVVINLNKEEYQCKICLLKTTSRSVLFFHLRRHMANYQWCDFCDIPLKPAETFPVKTSKEKIVELDPESPEVQLYFV